MSARRALTEKIDRKSSVVRCSECGWSQGYYDSAVYVVKAAQAFQNHSCGELAERGKEAG